jgi:hypothetical protein
MYGGFAIFCDANASADALYTRLREILRDYQP